MHYANGREAKVGDLVVGYGYNTVAREVPYGEIGEKKKLAAVLVKAVPGTDACNAEIEWIESTPVDGARPRMAVGEAIISQTGAGPRASWRCRDYTHVGALLHVEDVILLVVTGKRPDGALEPMLVPGGPHLASDAPGDGEVAHHPV